MGTGFGSQGFSFAPQTITVVIGVNNTVQWKNNDSQGVLHTVTSNPAGSFDSANLAPQETFTCAFITAGTYNYYCIYHPEMIGTVIVKSP